MDVPPDPRMCNAGHLPLSHCAVSDKLTQSRTGAPTNTYANEREAMDKHVVLSKTGKGLLQLKYKSHPMPDDQFRMLGLIDGKAMVIDLISSSQMNEAGLYNVLMALAESGFVREVAVPAATPDSPNVAVAPVLASEIDLDFTRSLGAAWKAPKGDV